MKVGAMGDYVLPPAASTDSPDFELLRLDFVEPLQRLRSDTTHPAKSLPSLLSSAGVVPHYIRSRKSSAQSIQPRKPAFASISLSPPIQVATARPIRSHP